MREAEGSEEPGDKGRLAPRQSGERSALVTAGVLITSPRAPAQTKQVCMGSVLMGSLSSVFFGLVSTWFGGPPAIQRCLAPLRPHHSQSGVAKTRARLNHEL